MTSRQCQLKGFQKAFYLTTNQVSSCCRGYGETLNPGTTLNEHVIRWQKESEQLTQGIEIESCGSCWTAERQGRESYRMQLAAWVPHEDINITVDNACNQQCSYCSPKFSSTWHDSIKTHGPFLKISASAARNLELTGTDVDTKYWLDQISQYIQQQPDHSVSITLLGGEPLMQLRPLQHMLELNTHKIDVVSLTTNLNPPNNKFLTWAVDHFPKQKLKVIVSIDASPEFNHVPRGLFDQNRFAENLQLLKQHNIHVEFISVISVLSMFDTKNFLRWIDSVQAPATFYALNNPTCLEPDLLPDFVKQQLLLDTNASAPAQITEILARPSTGTRIKWFEQYQYLQQYFQRVGIQPEQVANSLFQNWWNWLGQTATKPYKS
jgi:organic radical activating enzyme